MTLSDLLEKTKGHTPGPWKLEARPGDDSDCWVILEVKLYGKGIADLWGSASTRLPDAVLIAAAPYLLSLAQEQAAEIERLKGELGK